MAKSALKANSTQKFIDIVDISDDIVILSGGNACIIIEVQATNFDLLSADEQDAKIYTYSSLLNSLSFPIQILIRSKQLDISSYLKTLDEEAKKTTNPSLASQIGLYKNFVAELIKINTVLDKSFYVVIPYSALEAGALGAKGVLDKNSLNDFEVAAKSALHSKAESIHSQLSRINLKSETLTKERVIKLFYSIFNDAAMHPTQLSTAAKAPMVNAKEEK